MSLSNANRIITLDDILNYKTEIEILNFYLEIDNLPVMILSPLRPDRSPSFRIDYDENNHIRFYDFGGKNQCGGLFDLLMELYNLSFDKIIIKIYEEMINGKNLNKIVRNKSSTTKEYKSKISKLDVKVRPLRKYDLEFWGKGNLNAKWLEFGSIYPISHMFITKDGNEMVIPADKYAYVYVEYKDNIPTYKIYQPFSETYKWISKHDKSVWDLWNRLPAFGNILIITKSRKDALTIWANCGIPATCLQAESMHFKDNVVAQIKLRFKRIFLLYDNDWNKSENWGRIFGKKVSEELDIPQIEIPDEYQVTDPFEFVSKFSGEEFKQLINKLIDER